MNSKLYQALAIKCDAANSCAVSGNVDWQARHEDAVAKLADSFLPSGSGINCGSMVVIEKSDSKNLLIIAPYHHMDENGSYGGWFTVLVGVTPTLSDDFVLETGYTDNGTSKSLTWLDDHYGDYLYDTYDYALRQMVSDNV